MIKPVTSSGLVALIALSATLSPAAHHHHPIADGEHVRHAMADEDDRHAGVLQAADQVENLSHLPDRDRGGRLVHQHHARLRKAGAGDRDRLPLTARHLAHEVARPGLGLELAEQFAGALGHRLVVEPAERARAALDFAPKEHIGRRRQIVAERQVLVDDLDALLARLDGLMKVHRLAADADLAVGRGEIAGDDLDQGRLASAVVAHEPEHFASLERHVDFVQRMNRAEMLRHRVQFKNRQTLLPPLPPHYDAHATGASGRVYPTILACQSGSDWSGAQA